MTSGNGNPYPPPTQTVLPQRNALLVDEDEKDLDYFGPLLCHLGYAVRPFASYQEAESCLEHDHFDFVIVNQGSPAFEARRLVELALTRSRHTPVVVLTRCLEMNCYIEAMQLGAADYVEKPLSPAVFKHLVTTHARPRTREISTCPS
jgi:two-component system phosphoglycerate transport system response regulator PgtA